MFKEGKKMKNKKILILMILILTASQIKAITIGSDSFLDRFTAQQTLNNGDNIACFAALEGGFKLYNSGTTATFGSTFGVSGAVDLNAGTLTLSKDLVFVDQTTVANLGNINGNNHTLELCPSIKQLSTETSSKDFTFDNLTMILHSDIFIQNCKIKFSGNSSINGNGKTITLLSTATIAIDSNTTLALQNVVIELTNEDHIKCTDNTSNLQLKNITWVQANNYTLPTGTLDITENFEILGPDTTFSYQSTTTSFIKENGKLILGNNVTFDYNPSISNNQLLNLTDNTSQIILNGATLHGSYGLELTKGILELQRNATLSSDGTTENESIIFGDGSDSSNNLTIKMRPGNRLNVTSGKVLNKNV